MNLPTISLKRPVAVLMVVCIVVLLGTISFMGLPLDLFPDFEFPIAAVITSYDGAAPPEVENLVTRPLEGSLATVQGLENITSTSSPGQSLILLEFSWDTALDFAVQDVRDNIDLVRGFLPDGSGDPMIIKADPSMMPVVYLSLAGDREDWELRRFAEDIVEPRLERLNGVATVSIIGGRQQEVEVLVDPEALAHYNLSLDAITGALGRQNYNVAAGTVGGGSEQRHLRAIGEFTSLEEMGNLVLTSSPNETILLKDVAQVDFAFPEASQLNLFNNETSIGIQIQKQADANTVQVSRNIWNAMAGIENALPDGISVHKVMDQADFITESIVDVFRTGAVGAFLAIFILLLFLRNFRSTLVVSIAIPISLMATFTLMYFYGISLNIISLGGLALGLGIMVDNSIVVLENIFRFRQEGHKLAEASRSGSTQVAGAITAATLTTVIVFLPIVFLQGIAAEIFKDLATTVSFSLLASLLVALTVVPLLSSRLFKKVIVKRQKTEEEAPDEEIEEKPGPVYRLTEGFNRAYMRLENYYGRLLRKALQWRKTVLVIFVLSFLGSFALVPFIGMEFLPEMDEGIVQVQVDLPRGSDLERTGDVALRAKEIIHQLPEVDSVNLSVGGAVGMGFGGAGESHRASMEITLLDLAERERSDREVAEDLRIRFRQIAGAEFSVRTGGMMGGPGMGGAPISIAVRGTDLAELERLSDQMAALVAAVPGTREVETSFQEGRPELQAFVNGQAAADHGLSFSQVATSLRAASQGIVATRYRTGGTELDTRVIFSEKYSASPSSLGSIPLISPYGYRVTLQEITDFVEDEGPISIQRVNQARSASVEAQIVGRSQGEVMQDIISSIEPMQLPEGYFVDYEGDYQQMQESFSDLAVALLLAIVLVYMIMAAQFESLAHPLIIMFTLPQTFTGVVLSLFLTGRSLNVPAFIGIIMLSGIVVNNGIVLVDYINKLREKGMDQRSAILKAGPVRLRPILMTISSTVLAMFPLSLGIGSGAEMRTPMATVVIGGLLFSTLLTLIVIPVIYSIMEDLKIKIRTRRRTRTIVTGGRGT